MNLYVLAADGLLLLHTLFVIFVVGGLVLIIVGGLRGWPWVRSLRFRLAHVAAIAVVVLQSWLGRICPLTVWENELRTLGGQESYQSTFISYWLGRLLYYQAPGWVFIVCYTAFAALVLACWWWVRPLPPGGD